MIEVEELAANALFEPFTPEQVALVAGRMLEMNVPAGAVLVKEGDFGMRFFVVFKGTADVVRGGAAISELGDGSVFGEIGVAEGRRTATVTARTPMRIGALNKWDVDELGELIPGLADRLDRIVTARRLRDTRG